ncbi:MAG: hypothetical protein LBE82_06180 [Chitinophagaceae bacterium]|jgi:hypothetical protein|nr:hypothetical protein [Chitinophagaceae bacterium]
MKIATVRKINGHTSKKSDIKKVNPIKLKKGSVERVLNAANELKKKNIDLSYLLQ